VNAIACDLLKDGDRTGYRHVSSKNFDEGGEVKAFQTTTEVSGKL
jgi:hypothetical protein